MLRQAQAVEKLGEGKLQGPEDVYVDGDGTLYTATRDGWIKRMLANGSDFEDWMLGGGGALLGLALARDDPERVLVCDADKVSIRSPTLINFLAFFCLLITTDFFFINCASILFLFL